MFACALASPGGMGWAQPQKIAILPFSINAEKELSYIQEGVFQMLSSRLACKDKITIVTGETIFAGLHGTPQLSGDALVKAVVGSHSVQYIISGSITEFAGTFSMDAKVYSVTSDTPIQTFFGQADTVDHIIPTMDRIAAEINQKIFNRQTYGLAKADDNKKNAPQKDLSRANPETLIPQIPTTTETKKKPFWMFWEKNPPPSYPDEGIVTQKSEPVSPLPPEPDEGEENVDKKAPFWKFWEKSNPAEGDEDDEVDLEMRETQDDEGDADAEEQDKPFWKIW